MGQDYFSHKEHEVSQRNTKQDERRRKIYIYENRVNLFQSVSILFYQYEIECESFKNDLSSSDSVLALTIKRSKSGGKLQRTVKTLNLLI